MKRPGSPGLVQNPFVKAENREWELTPPSSLSSRVSPPPTAKRKKPEAPQSKTLVDPSTAAVEAGKAEIDDHLAFFYEKLSRALRPATPRVPRISLEEWVDLYQRNLHPQGHHFVVHQHDHPVAGTHYDLRLQCNATSSISFSLPYGLPGDPNSRRPNRNAIETRVHNLWNHLIETASYATGSMLIWDTGEYTVLPYPAATKGAETDGSEASEDSVAEDARFDSEKLANAFRQRRIRLRLDGTRLPRGYTISLRLTKDNFKSTQPKRPSRRRRRAHPKTKRQQTETSSDTDASSSTVTTEAANHLASLIKTESPPKKGLDHSEQAIAVASDDESETIRLNNAYTGATNSIGSIHQRRWFLTLDRENSGFVPYHDNVSGKRWVRKRRDDGQWDGFDRFVVMGRDSERSLVTGRLGADVLVDEGVEGYVPRGLWHPITE